MNCIIIDDEELSRRVLHKLCSKVKDLHITKIFGNPKDALTFLQSNKVDFILLDLHMPILNGYEFIEALEDPPKIILTTIDRASAIQAFEYKCIVDYLGKPFNFPRFAHALDRVKRAIELVKNSQNNLNDHDQENLFINLNM